MDKIGISQPNNGIFNESTISMEKVFNETGESGASSLEELNKDYDELNYKSKISEDLLDVGQNINISSYKIVEQDDNSMKEKDLLSIL